jgi:hypothetical protein
MTPDDLDVIRARVALYADPEWRGTHSPKWVEVACDDAAALLAEVDRLTEGNATLVATMLAVTEASDGMAKARHDCGADDERDRIVSEVQRLPVYPGADYTSGRVDRAAVIAAIEGETT